MDAPQDQNPYLELDQNELNKKLWEAASYNQLTNVSLLIEAKADINAQDEEGWTPLMYAANNGCYEVAELLTNNKDVALNISSLPYGFTALEYAADSGNPMILDLLIRKNAERIQKLPEGPQKQEEQKQVQQKIEKMLKLNINYIGSKSMIFDRNLSWEENIKLAESKIDYSIIFRLLSAIPSSEHKRVNTAGMVEKFDAALQHAKTKLYKVMMPSFLNKHPKSIFCILPQELINYIRDLQLQLEFSSPHSWYQHRIKNDLDNSGQEIINYMKMNKYFLPIKKRKSEDDLDEKGRNKRMRTDGVNNENNEEQEMNVDQHNHYSSGLGANK